MLYSFPEEFQHNKELAYKGHEVKEYKRYYKGKLRTRYFGYKNKIGKIIKHGLLEGFDENGMQRVEMLYSDGLPDGPFFLKDEKGNIVAQGIYKNGRPWDGKFLIGDYSDSIFVFAKGNNIAFEDKNNGRILAQGTWKNNKKWNGSFYNMENGKIEYYKNGELVKGKRLEDIL